MACQSTAILYTLAPPDNPRMSETHIIVIPSLEMKWMRSERSLSYPPAGLPSSQWPGNVTAQGFPDSWPQWPSCLSEHTANPAELTWLD